MKPFCLLSAKFPLSTRCKVRGLDSTVTVEFVSLPFIDDFAFDWSSSEYGLYTKAAVVDG